MPPLSGLFLRFLETFPALSQQLKLLFHSHPVYPLNQLQCCYLTIPPKYSGASLLTVLTYSSHYTLFLSPLSLHFLSFSPSSSTRGHSYSTLFVSLSNKYFVLELIIVTSAPESILNAITSHRISTCMNLYVAFQLGVHSSVAQW